MEAIRNVEFGQWNGCLFVHAGTTCWILARLPGDRSWGLEILTPARWFALRPFRRLTWRRQ